MQNTDEGCPVENTLKINEKTNSIIICKCAGFF